MVKMFASKEIAQARKATCDSCEKKTMLTCNECGCLIPAKVRLGMATCPLNKWSSSEAVLDQPWDIQDIQKNGHEQQLPLWIGDEQNV
jgi:hypothetical protein